MSLIEDIFPEHQKRRLSNDSTPYLDSADEGAAWELLIYGLNVAQNVQFFIPIH